MKRWFPLVKQTDYRRQHRNWNIAMFRPCALYAALSVAADPTEHDDAVTDQVYNDLLSLISLSAEIAGW